LEVLFLAALFKGLASGAKKLLLVTTQDNVVGEETGHGGSLLRASLCASRLCVKKNFCARKKKNAFSHEATKERRYTKGLLLALLPWSVPSPSISEKTRTVRK